ncbi:MAG TPA: MotA/TolQ/ExbB proton channel family protein, partial [Spirochaetales bacterium]|nr:MotA/TolQ/ExbB proton channel family protein [Spirochaetales bacterium]
AVSDPSVLAKGVSEALITTVGGIIVAVPAVIFYNYLVTRVNTILIKMENQVNALIAILSPQVKQEEPYKSLAAKLEAKREEKRL